MKRAAFFSVIVLTVLSMTGCACYGPGYGYKGSCASSCSPCGSNQMGIDYVDGFPGACEADCGSAPSCGPASGYAQPGCGGSSYNGYNTAGSCSSCLKGVGEGLKVLGEGALAVVSAPFVLAGHVLCGNSCGNGGAYGGGSTYPNCGCSNEVYYGDNCYQPHDFCDPCGCGGPTNGSTNCPNCAGGFTEGIQPMEEGDLTTVPAPLSNQVTRQQPVPDQRYRPVSNGRMQQPVRVTRR